MQVQQNRCPQDVAVVALRGIRHNEQGAPEVDSLCSMVSFPLEDSKVLAVSWCAVLNALRTNGMVKRSPRISKDMTSSFFLSCLPMICSAESVCAYLSCSSRMKWSYISNASDPFGELQKDTRKIKDGKMRRPQVLFDECGQNFE